MRHYNVTKPTKRPQTRTTPLHQFTTTETDSTSSATQPPLPGLLSNMLIPLHSKLLPNLIGKVSFAMKRRKNKLAFKKYFLKGNLCLFFFENVKVIFSTEHLILWFETAQPETLELRDLSEISGGGGGRGGEF